MSKTLAIIDLDTSRVHGQTEKPMIANTSERSRIARDYANQFRNREQASAFFVKMFDPDLVKLDVIEQDARTRVEHIEARGAQVVYLTSRPHTMQETTKQWLREQGISRPCYFKNYGSDEPGPDGKVDMGDRYMKTPVWKAREVQRIVNQVETEMGEKFSWIIFADDEEANRAAVAGLNDPRILVRCSLEDAATHDFEHHEVDQNLPPFLRRLQELATILEMREVFDTAEQCQLTITRPELPDQDNQEKHISILIESWRTGDGRMYRYNELYPQRNELSEIELIVSLQATCDQDGCVESVKMAKHGAALSLLNELEDIFGPDESEKMQGYADEWLAHAIGEFGYVEVARVQRGMQISGSLALDAYVAHIQAKNEEIKVALRGGKQYE